MPFYLLIFTLIFAPLAYGTTGPIAMTIVQTAVLSALLWLWIEASFGRRKLHRPPGLLPLGLLAGLMLLQMVPLPPGLLHFISPVTWQRYTETVWLLQPELWMPLSFNLQRSVTAFFYFCTCVACYLLAVNCLSGNRRLKTTVRIVTAFAGLYALAAIFESLLPNGRVLWLLRLWPEGVGKPFGANINGNHYANLMAMLLPLAVMLFLVEKPLVQYGGWKERFVDYCSDPKLGAHLFTAFAALLMAASIFLSLSRGGILSTLGAMLVLCLLLAWRRHYRRQALILIGFVVVLFFFIGVFGWDAIFEAFARIRNLQGDITDGRLFYWRDCLALFRDFPLFGTGFGAFIDSFAGYQSLYQAELVVDHAHNDYLELFAEGGLVGLALAGWTLWLVLRTSWKGFSRRRQVYSVSLYLGSLAGLVALLLHCVTEFNLHIGANGLYFAFLGALLVATATISSQRGSGSELPGLSRRAVLIVAPLLAVVLLGSLWFNLGGLVAEATLAPDQEVRLASLDPAEQAAVLQRARQAVALAPLTSAHRYFEVRALLAAGQTEEAMPAYGRLLQSRPLSAFYLQRAAALANDLNRLPLAESLLKSGVALDRADLRRIRAYAGWLLSQQQTQPAFAEIRRGLQLAPDQTRSFIDLMVVKNIAPPEMAGALPELARVWLHYANFLLEVKYDLAGEGAYRHAILLMAEDASPIVSAHLVLVRFLEKNDRIDEALAVTMDGLALFPDNAGLHSIAGRLYERQQIYYRASEEYRQALLLDPKLEWVRKRLARVEKGR